MDKRLLRITNAYLLLITIAMYVLTGFGITQYQFVEKATFGILNKALSFKIHFWLIIPLVAFLAIHLILSHLKAKHEDF